MRCYDIVSVKFGYIIESFCSRAAAEAYLAEYPGMERFWIIVEREGDLT
jgi:hypothetical protein